MEYKLIPKKALTQDVLMALAMNGFSISSNNDLLVFEREDKGEDENDDDEFRESSFPDRPA